MTVREIQSYVEEMYGTDVSPTLISSVIDEVKTRLTTSGHAVTPSSISTAFTLRC